MKKSNKVVPRRNYYILTLLIVMVVVVTFLIFDMNEEYQNSKLDSSYLSGYINEVSENEIKNIMVEPTSDFFVLITETGNENVYKFETQLKKIIRKYDLRDNFILIDYSDNKDNLDSLNKKFNSDIKGIPAILYFKNGELIKSIDSSKEMLKSSDFDMLLDEYEIKEG